MKNLYKNCTVKILSNDIWNNKIGTIISNTSGDDKSLVKVKILLNSKPVIQLFPESCLTLCNDDNIINENKNSENEFKANFIDNLINKKCLFLGLDYSNIFSINNNNEYDVDDIKIISEYKKYENLECKILKCSISGDISSEKSFSKNFNDCFWDIQFDDNFIMNSIPGTSLSLLEIDWNSLTNEDFDYMKSYVIEENLDGYKNSWIYADIIAASENFDLNKVISDAKKLNYSTYKIKENNKVRYIIASNKTALSDISEHIYSLKPNAIILEN